MRGGGKVEFLDQDPLSTASRLLALANDLRRLAAGHVPRVELTRAPLLTRWGLTNRPTLVLTGSVHGHPLIDEGHPVISSEIFAIDADRRWARTLSRYYQLVPQGREQADA